jgi:hypothetical protein
MGATEKVSMDGSRASRAFFSDAYRTAFNLALRHALTPAVMIGMNEALAT